METALRDERTDRARSSAGVPPDEPAYVPARGPGRMASEGRRVVGGRWALRDGSGPTGRPTSRSSDPWCRAGVGKTRVRRRAKPSIPCPSRLRPALGHRDWRPVHLAGPGSRDPSDPRDVHPYLLGRLRESGSIRIRRFEAARLSRCRAAGRTSASTVDVAGAYARELGAESPMDFAVGQIVRGYRVGPDASRRERAGSHLAPERSEALRVLAESWLAAGPSQSVDDLAGLASAARSASVELSTGAAWLAGQATASKPPGASEAGRRSALPLE
jgi:hypothetical protein